MNKKIHDLEDLKVPETLRMAIGRFLEAHPEGIKLMMPDVSKHLGRFTPPFSKEHQEAFNSLAAQFEGIAKQLSSIQADTLRNIQIAEKPPVVIDYSVLDKLRRRN